MTKKEASTGIVGQAGRALVRQLPPHARLRVRQVKRALLGQPPPAVTPPRSARGNRQPTPHGAATNSARVRHTNPRASIPGSSRLETRRSSIFATARRDGHFLEIGPAHNGTLPRRDGFDTQIVDYLDRAGLVDKYKEFKQYSPDDIEEVDFVLAPGAAMADAITDRFDLVLASHVLEHTTSLIDFVQECATLLRPGGVLALIVPDHRYCFDRFRQRSSIGVVIDASMQPQPVHSVGTLTEFALYATRHRDTTSWTPDHRGRYSLVHGIDSVRATAAKGKTGVYVDVHHWVFSPHHLRLMLHDLADLGYVSLREAYFHDTVGHEFFINLTAESTGPSLTRQELISRADEELRFLDAPDWEPVETVPQ